MQALSGLGHRTLPVLVFLGFSLRLACGTAFTSVGISRSVSGSMPAQGGPAECPLWTRRKGVCRLFPLLGNVDVQSGQQEAYAKVVYLPRLDGLLNSKLAHAFT